MIIFGANPVTEAVRAHPKRVRFIGVTKEQNTRMAKLVAEARNAGVNVRIMSNNDIDRLTNRAVHNGVIADVDAGTYADFHDTVMKEETKFVLILDGIT